MEQVMLAYPFGFIRFFVCSPFVILRGFVDGLEITLFNSSEPSKCAKVFRMLTQKATLNASECSVKCGFKALPQ